MIKKLSDGVDQMSCLMDDVQTAGDMVKSVVAAQIPLDASRVLIEANGELLQLTFEYFEQCVRILEAAMRRMNGGRVQ